MIKPRFVQPAWELLSVCTNLHKQCPLLPPMLCWMARSMQVGNFWCLTSLSAGRDVIKWSPIEALFNWSLVEALCNWFLCSPTAEALEMITLYMVSPLTTENTWGLQPFTRRYLRQYLISDYCFYNNQVLCICCQAFKSVTPPPTSALISLLAAGGGHLATISLIMLI